MSHITTMQQAFMNLPASAVEKPVGRLIAKRIESRIKYGQHLIHQRAVERAILEAEQRFLSSRVDANECPCEQCASQD